MFARVIELKTETGKAREVCAKIHERVLSALRAQPGFIDEIVLTSNTKESSPSASGEQERTRSDIAGSATRKSPN